MLGADVMSYNVGRGMSGSSQCPKGQERRGQLSQALPGTGNPAVGSLTLFSLVGTSGYDGDAQLVLEGEMTGVLKDVQPLLSVSKGSIIARSINTESAKSVVQTIKAAVPKDKEQCRLSHRKRAILSHTTFTKTKTQTHICRLLMISCVCAATCVRQATMR